MIRCPPTGDSKYTGISMDYRSFMVSNPRVEKETTHCPVCDETHGLGQDDFWLEDPNIVEPDLQRAWSEVMPGAISIGLDRDLP
jgi:hypothetical protein